MPPTTEAIPRPRDRGESALAYLEAHGICPVVPTIRGSDFDQSLRDPFRYYLTRRLGLTDCLSYSEALSQGTWFHRRFFDWSLPEEMAKTRMRAAFDERVEELTTICRAHGIGEESMMNILDQEERDMKLADVWWQAFSRIKLPGYGRTLEEWLQRPGFRDLGGEMEMGYWNEGHAVTCVIQPDRLVYDEDQNLLWIFDPKTTATSTLDRLLLCPIEFATQHYLHVLDHLVTMGLVSDTFGLPHDVRVGGMIHVAYRKPTIRLSPQDRDFEEAEHMLRSGPRKGEIEVRRSYRGEPKWDNYLQRCVRWMLGEGEYEGHHREEDPVVNVSVVGRAIFDDISWKKEYARRLSHLADLAKMRALPERFLRPGIRGYGSQGRDPLADFYLADVQDWPALIKEKRLIQWWRDEHLQGASEPFIVINKR